ncbi:MAG: hypothetical protein BGO01_08715 [Armatimonadetes bacterium 55-13]|nr:family 10 glycosylhydrolase [Armatimonadota bacterium]OJU61943.1 MAG: hypothetical protein BGO01_08715 [Armatimonadetes bacterium 55-13]
MKRRDFLRLAVQAGCTAGLAGTLRFAESASGPAERPKNAMSNRKYWIWNSIDKKATDQALKEKYKALKGHGLTGVYIAGELDDREFEIIKAAGLEIHTWMWTTNRRDQWIRDNHPDWYMVSRTGKSCFDQPPYVDYYRWVSPVIPGVQSYLKDKVAELAQHPAVSGVHLDYVRYPDVILPKALWKTYNLDQTEELPDYDFCYSEHTRKAFKEVSGRDPMDIKDPAHDQEWLHFRYDSVTKLVKQLAQVVHDHKKIITAAVFPTPRLARKICRQDWDKWPLDAACPMIYHSFYDESVEWVGECVLENIQTATFPIYAGLYMPAFHKPEELEQAIGLVHKRGGAGVSLFGDVGPEYWKAFEKAIAD